MTPKMTMRMPATPSPPPSPPDDPPLQISPQSQSPPLQLGQSLQQSPTHVPLGLQSGQPEPDPFHGQQRSSSLHTIHNSLDSRYCTCNSPKSQAGNDLRQWIWGTGHTSSRIRRLECSTLMSPERQ